MNVALEPSVLRWARERAGLDCEALARKVGVQPEKVVLWEETGQITLKQAERLAKSTHAPFGALYLDEPPIETLPISDFRTVGSSVVSRPSLDLIEVLDSALERQDWFREYAIQNGAEPLDWINSLNGHEDVEPTARRISDRLSLETASRIRAKDWEEALRLSCTQLEKEGVLITRSSVAGQGTNRLLQVDEFRGFALSDKWAPLIFINTRDWRPAQIFTLFHELIHLWLGVSGISNLEQTDASTNNYEQFCNAVAAEILVPKSELKERFEAGIQDVAELGKHFKVSILVMLRRLRDLQFITRSDFARQYSAQIARFQQQADEEKSKKEDKTGGPPYYRLKISRLGRRFVGALLESVFEGHTSPVDAFRLLGVRNFDAMRNLAKELNLEIQ